MRTTNAASRSLPATYVTRREECEKLLRVARHLEQLALNNPDFSNSAEFKSLQADYGAQLRNVLSISG